MDFSNYKHIKSLSAAIEFNKMANVEATADWLDTVKESFTASVSVVFDFMFSISKESKPIAVKQKDGSIVYRSNAANDFVKSTGIIDSISDISVANKNNNASASMFNPTDIIGALGIILESELRNDPDHKAIISCDRFDIKFSYDVTEVLEFNQDLLRQKSGVRTVTTFADSKYEGCFKHIDAPALDNTGCKKSLSILDPADYNRTFKEKISIDVDFKKSFSKKEEN